MIDADTVRKRAQKAYEESLEEEAKRLAAAKLAVDIEARNHLECVQEEILRSADEGAFQCEWWLHKEISAAVWDRMCVLLAEAGYESQVTKSGTLEISWEKEEDA